MPIGAHYHIVPRLFSDGFRAADAIYRTKGELYGIHDLIHVMMDSPGLIDKGSSQCTRHNMENGQEHT
jgi:hypothetical protein